MPSFCIVCSRDLATDPTAEPPFCGQHARDNSTQKRAEQFQRDELIRLGTLPMLNARVVRSHEGGMPGLIKHKVVRNEHLVGDRVEFESWSRTVPYKRQYTSREFAVSIRIETWSEEFKEASEYVTKTKMLNGPEVANIVMGFHQALVRAGWRPYQEQRTYGSYALPQDAHVGSGDGWGQVDGFYKDHFYALDPSVDELHFWRLGNMGRGYYLPEFSQANPPVAPSTEVHEPQRKRFWRKN